MYYFTADEHYGHKNIIEFCNRPFSNVKEMDETLISNFNTVVGNTNENTTIHAGDFSFKNWHETEKLIKRLNGKHIFLQGSHDKWAKDYNFPFIWEKGFSKNFVVVCHYCMRTWRISHYNSFHFFGHSHGKLEPIGKSWDIGVDNNNFKPVSWNEIKMIMEKRPDNPNLVKKKVLTVVN